MGRKWRCEGCKRWLSGTPAERLRACIAYLGKPRYPNPKHPKHDVVYATYLYCAGCAL